MTSYFRAPTLTRARRVRPVSALFLALFSILRLDAQSTNGTVLGRISGPEDAPLADVLVSLESAGGSAETRGVLTDASGRFLFVAVAPGAYRVRAQRIGFTVVTEDVRVAPGGRVEVDLAMLTDALIVEGVLARGRLEADRERARFESEPGVTARVVEAEFLKTLPGLGESDILRAVQLLPGVVSTSDFSSSYSVRGGSPDQNLILIDGFPVFNPVHLGGIFSVFNSDAVARAELFAGGFGAEFGGRVSSVLNIESRTDPPDGVEVQGGVSMLASRVMVRGPLGTAVPGLLGGGGGSWLLSARRSYFDQILRPIAEFPYHLTDLQGHLSSETRGGGRLSVTGYWGEDLLDLSNLDSDTGAAAALRLRWGWGNRVLGTHLRQPIGNGWVAEGRVGYSEFQENLRFASFGDVRFGSRISQHLLRGELARDMSPEVSLRVGGGADRIAYLNVAEAGGTSFFDLGGAGWLTGAFGSVRWRPSGWIIEPGLRLDRWEGGATRREVLAPRFSAKRFLGTGGNSALKFSAGRYSQFIHSLKDDELPIANDTWVLAGADVPVIVSDQVQAGIESFWGTGWSASVEGYARRFEGVTELNFADDPNDPSDDLLVGDGYSYGLDLLLRRFEGRLTGWVTLSLLRAERTFPDPLTAGWADLPQTVTYPPIFDRRVNFDIVTQYLTRGGVELGARWNYGTGLPYTRPVAQYLSWRQNPLEGRAEPFSLGFGDDDEVPTNVVLGRRNSERYPPYHRLDLTARKRFDYRWGSMVPYVQVLNVYNRRNVLFYFYDYNRTPPVRSGFSMFPILPALGVEVSF